MNQSVTHFVDTFTPDSGDVLRAYMWPYLLFVGLFVVGIAVSLLPSKTFFNRHATKFMMWAGFIGLVVYWFRFEEVLYFDSNIWLFLLYSGVVLWALWLLVVRYVRIPKQEQQQKVISIQKKYLPKSHQRLKKEKHG